MIQLCSCLFSLATGLRPCAQLTRRLCAPERGMEGRDHSRLVCHRSVVSRGGQGLTSPFSVRASHCGHPIIS